MKIKYNDSENTIEIKDGLKSQYLKLKILMALNLANAIIRLIGHKRKVRAKQKSQGIKSLIAHSRDRCK